MKQVPVSGVAEQRKPTEEVRVRLVSFQLKTDLLGLQLSEDGSVPAQWFSSRSQTRAELHSLIDIQIIKNNPAMSVPRG